MMAKFITFEGIEGAGKSTQIPLLASWLSDHNIPFIVTREPGGTQLGEKLRNLLLQDNMHAKTEALLMFAARSEHVETIIQPALAAGKWVLCDRFIEASYAYQGGGRALGFEKIEILENWLLDDFRPDLTFLFDLPVEAGLNRTKKRAETDRFEKEQTTFFEEVRAAYQQRASIHADRIYPINAQSSIEDVSQAIIQELKKWL